MTRRYINRATLQLKPVVFLPQLIPKGKLVHSGILSPDSTKYFFTISDAKLSKFDVMVSEYKYGEWTEPKYTHFNSEYNEHGTAFSADGKIIYFSSTRPVSGLDIKTWKLWKVDLQKGSLEPEYVEIPNLKNKLVSHPSLTGDGVLYLHAGNSDYSDLNIYRCLPDGDEFLDAKKLSGSINFGTQHCTPFVSRDESYLIFECSGELYISSRDTLEDWNRAVRLNSKVNRDNRGNPFVSADGEFLFYASASESDPNAKWQIEVINFGEAIKPDSTLLQR